MICYCFCSGPAQAAKMREIKIFAARHTYSPHAPHLQFVGDTIGALGWVVAGDKPIHFIRESYDGGKHHVKHIPGEMSMTQACLKVWKSGGIMCPHCLPPSNMPVTNFCQKRLPTYLFNYINSMVTFECFWTVTVESKHTWQMQIRCFLPIFCSVLSFHLTLNSIEQIGQNIVTISIWFDVCFKG